MNAGGWDATPAPVPDASSNNDDGGWGSAPAPVPAASSNNDDGGWAGEPDSVTAPVQSTQAQADDGGWRGEPEKHSSVPASTAPVQKSASADDDGGWGGEPEKVEVARGPDSIPVSASKEETKPEEDDGGWGNESKKVEAPVAPAPAPVEEPKTEPEDGGWGGEPEKVEQPQEKRPVEAEQPESKADEESKPAIKAEINPASDSKPSSVAGSVKAESVSSKQDAEHHTPKSVASSLRESSAPPSQGASSPRPFAQPFTPRTVQNSLLFASPVQRHISPVPSIVGAGYLDGRASPFTPGYISPLAAPGPYPIPAAPVGVPPVPAYTAPIPVIPAVSPPIQPSGPRYFEPARSDSRVSIKTPNGAPVMSPAGSNASLPTSSPVGQAGYYEVPHVPVGQEGYYQQAMNPYDSMSSHVTVPVAVGGQGMSGFVEGPDGAYYPVSQQPGYGYRPFGYGM